MYDTSLIHNVKIGDRDVVYSTQYFMPADSNKLEFDLGDNKKFVILFSYDSNEQSTRYIGTPEGGMYVLKLINFSNVLGEGISEPIAFFKKNNVQYYITLWVETNTDKSRRINVTVTKG